MKKRENGAQNEARSEPLDYEAKLEAAKKIIAELSKADLPLNRAVSLFKEARSLLDSASETLENAKSEYEQMEATEKPPALDGERIAAGAGVAGVGNTADDRGEYGEAPF